MRICWRLVAVASISFSIASVAIADQPEVDLFALMAGRCSTLKVVDRDFACSSVAFSHSPGGRSAFTVPLNDSEDDTHIITFSGENGKRKQDNLYELSIDRMLLKSKDRPKVDGLPIPAVEPSTGTCKQIGNLAAQQVSSISCSATDGSGKKYELQFESDGSPIKVKMIKAADPDIEARNAAVLSEHIEQIKCRQMADAAGVLPRDRTAYILRCMDE
jgi:hypothetical protein